MIQYNSDNMPAIPLEKHCETCIVTSPKAFPHSAIKHDRGYTQIRVFCSTLVLFQLSHQIICFRKYYFTYQYFTAYDR